MRVAFLGVGAMGTGIASNILKAGFVLSIWNKKDSCYQNIEVLQRLGATPCESIGAAAAGRDIVGMSLTNDQAVREVGGELLTHIKAGAVVCDFSTISPQTSKEMNALFAERGAFYLDCPVSGGIEGASAGTLTIMAGGDFTGFQKAECVLRSVSSKLEYLGQSGSGSVAKLVNQLLTAANQAIVCEAMLLSFKSGLDMQKLYDLLVVSWGSSKMLKRSVINYILPGKYESSACIELMEKDLTLVKQMAEDFGIDIPIGNMVETFFRKAVDEGRGRQDHAAIIEVMKRTECV